MRLPRRAEVYVLSLPGVSLSSTGWSPWRNRYPGVRSTWQMKFEDSKSLTGRACSDDIRSHASQMRVSTGALLVGSRVTSAQSYVRMSHYHGRRAVRIERVNGTVPVGICGVGNGACVSKPATAPYIPFSCIRGH
jgi:hypothetical protein